MPNRCPGPAPGPALGIVADDLSGANDTGLQFAKRGLRTVVLFERPRDEPVPATVVVLDTDSRQIPAALAAERAQLAARALRGQGVGAVYKKVDSTLRGNLGAEVDALLDELGAEAALVAPSFPANGRIVVDGRLLLHGVPLEETEFARDPLWPAESSRVADAIARQSRHKIGEVRLAAVRQGPGAILAEVERRRASGVRVVALDATTSADLEAIARAVAASNGRWIAVGSAGLAEELPGALRLRGAPTQRADSGESQGPGTERLDPDRPRPPALAVVGSLNPVSRRQLAELRDAVAVELRVEALLSDAGESSGEVERATDVVRRALLAGQDASLCLAAGAEGATLRARLVAAGLPPGEVATRLADGLGRVVAALLSSGTLAAGLVMTGGDTAKGVCRALGAHGVLVEREVLPGIPQGRLLGGVASGLAVVTKAGGFGPPDALAGAARFLRDLA